MQEQPRATIPLEERQERLSHLVSSRTLEGWVVADKNDREPSAVLRLPGKPLNHILHLVLTVVTCGVWGIVWVILVLTHKGEKRMRVSIDQHGNLLEETIEVSS